VKRDEADQMFAEFLAGALDRRTFVTRLIAAGASVSAVATVLEACSGGTAEQPPAPEEDKEKAKAKAKAKAPDEDDLGEPEKELSIYNWSDYIGETTVADFEKESGIKVTYATYESNEEMLSKLKVGAGGYDLVVPTGYIVTVLAAQNLIAPLHKKHIPNFDNIAPLFKNPTYDPDNISPCPGSGGRPGSRTGRTRSRPRPTRGGSSRTRPTSAR